VADVLALRPAAAAQVAEALVRGHVATVDADPQRLQAAYFAAAIDEVSQRLAELQHHRNPPAPAEPDLHDEKEAWEEVDLSDLLADLPPPPRRSRPVVEISPPYDHAEITAFAAASVLYELLAGVAARRRGGPPAT